jgi:hypothetical protein
MEQYIGVKIINAKPMSRQEYNDFRGWELPEDENGADEGYLVEYVDGGQANTEAYEGYVSWSPKDVFERAYRQTEGMTFGMAIEAAKKGCKIARKGWNGKNMFVVYQKGYPEGIPANKNTAEAFGLAEGELFKVRPYLQMRCADGTHQMWLASQSDILEEDWVVVG